MIHESESHKWPAGIGTPPFPSSYLYPPNLLCVRTLSVSRAHDLAFLFLQAEFVQGGHVSVALSAKAVDGAAEESVTIVTESVTAGGSLRARAQGGAGADTEGLCRGCALIFMLFLPSCKRPKGGIMLGRSVYVYLCVCVRARERGQTRPY